MQLSKIAVSKLSAFSRVRLGPRGESSSRPAKRRRFPERPQAIKGDGVCAVDERTFAVRPARSGAWTLPRTLRRSCGGQPRTKEYEHGDARYASLHKDPTQQWIWRHARGRVWYADPRSARDQTGYEDSPGSGIPTFRLRGALPQ